VLLDTAFEMVGYGDTGDGRTGAVPDDEATPVKRFALNVVERESGQGDRFTAEFDPPGEGSLGPLEGTIGPGDSGGPAFVTDALLAALAEAGGGPVEYMPTTGERVLIGAVSYMTVPRAEQPFGTYGSGAVYTALWPLAEWIAGFDIDVTLVPTTSACGIVACRSSAGPGLTTGGTAAPVPLGGSLGFLAAALVVLSAWTGRARARSRSQSRFEAG
jgi:hypothetical protein